MRAVKNLICFVLLALTVVAQAQEISKKDLKGKIVFASDRAGNWDIWIMNADGSDPKALTSSPEPEVDPRFSPDGKKILFSAKRGDKNEVWIMGADGKDQKSICEGDQVDWSPDGKSIAFRRSWQVMIRNLETNEEKAISPKMWSHCVLPAWSPDGGKIAFAARLVAGYSIYLQDLSKSKPEKLIGEKGSCEPHWSRDGRLIAFQDESHIYTIEPSGKDKYQVTTGGGVQHYPEWSPDNKLIVYCQAPSIEGPWQICVVSADGGTPIQLTDTASNMNPDWRKGEEGKK